MMQDEKKFIESLGYTGKETKRVKIRDYVSAVYSEEDDKEEWLKDLLEIKKGDIYLIVSMKVKPAVSEGER